MTTRPFVIVIDGASEGSTPRSGLDIADFVTRSGWDALALFQPAGRLTEAARSRGIHYAVAQAEGFRSGSFRDKVAAARAEIEALQPSVVYANSIAASAWAVAGRQIGAKVVVHAREFDDELMALTRSGATCFDLCGAADLVVVPHRSAVASLRRHLGYVPDSVIEIGSLADGAELAAQARQPVSAEWSFGRPYANSARSLITMWGTAGPSRGVDIFVAAARRLPDFDFLWIGPWTEEADHNLHSRGLEADKIANLYCTGACDNPYYFIASCSLFAATASNTNMTQLMEVAAMGKPILLFSESGEAAKVLGNGVYLLHGRPDTDRIVALLPKLLEGSGTGPSDDARVTVSADRQTALARLIEELKSRAIW
jgi:hypothetical protein